MAAPPAQVALVSRMLRVLAVPGLLSLLLTAVWIVHWSQDRTPSPDLSGLAFVPRLVPEEDNLYLALARHCAHLKNSPLVPADQEDDSLPLPPPELFSFAGGPPELLQASRPLLLERLLAGQGWSPERHALLAPSLDKLVLQWRMLSRLPEAQAPFAPPRDSSQHSYDIRSALLPHLQLACWSAYRSGRQAEAFDRALLGYRLGLSIRDSHGNLFDYHNGVVIARTALNTLGAMIAEPDADHEAVSNILAELRPLEPAHSDAFDDSLRHHFAVARHRIENFDVAEASSDERYRGVLSMAARTRVLFPIAFRRRETLAEVAHTARHALLHSGHPPPPPTRLSGGAMRICRHCELIAPTTLADFDNALGELLAGEVLAPRMVTNIRREAFQLRETFRRLCDSP